MLLSCLPDTKLYKCVKKSSYVLWLRNCDCNASSSLFPSVGAAAADDDDDDDDDDAMLEEEEDVSERASAGAGALLLFGGGGGIRVNGK